MTRAVSEIGDAYVMGEGRGLDEGNSERGLFYEDATTCVYIYIYVM